MKSNTLGMLLVACAAGNAHAGTVLYDNLGDTFTTNSQLTETLDQSFSTGSSSLLLNDLKLVLDIKGSDTGSFTVGLYSDSSTAPGALLLGIATVDDTSLTLAATTVDFPIADFALAANTRYWIGLVPSLASIEGSWESSNPQPSDTGVAGQFADYGGSTFIVGPATAPAFQMSIDAVTETTTPEPSSGLLLVAGFFAMCWLSRLFRRSAEGISHR